MNINKKFQLSFAVVLVLLTLSIAGLASSWKIYNSTKDKFNIDFPANPKFSTRKTKVPDSNLVIKQNSYRINDEKGVMYYVFVNTFNLKIDDSNPDENLKGALGDIVSSDPKIKVVSSKFGNFKGHRALDFLVKNGNVSMKGKLFLVGQALYEIMAAYESKNSNDKDFNRFLNSFSLRK